MMRLWYDRVVAALVFVAFSVMLGAALIGTVSRYFTFLPIVTWGEEVTRFAGIWAVFLVSGISLRHGAHFGVDTLTRALSPRAERAVAVISFLLVAAFLLVLLIYGVRVSAENMVQYSPALEWKIGIIYLCIPIGAILMLIETIAILRRIIRGEPAFEPPISGVVE
jgi:TRAP-type C4-dicarboxylate transport system permease small subunit